MPPFIAVIVLVLLLGASSRARAQSDPVVASRAAYQEAVRAYEAHDLPTFLRHAKEAERLRPTHGGVISALASAYALSGDTSAALATLRHYAKLGYTADLDADADLAALRGQPAYDSLRQALRANAAPLVRSRPAFTLVERDLLTEGIAYDPSTRSFLVGSVHQGKILRVDARGHATTFVPAGLPGFWAPLGMRVDPARRALWVAASALPQTAGFDSANTGRSGVFRFDLATGALTGRYPIPDDGQPHTLGDVAIARNGDVYATDSRAPAVYRVRAGADSIERFLTSPLLLSAQGLALDADERSLYVADYSRGMLRVDLATREVRQLDTADDVLTLGIDGLYLVGGSLIGIQNGVTPHRVVRLRLDAGGNRVEQAEVLERARPDYAEPTLGVVVGRDLYYVAASQWEKFRDDGTIDGPKTLRPPLVLRLRL
ncbi:MAG: SMP-30/gluconolactonase/LRE family protein [Gemmatimonadales bacterium]